MTDGQVFFGALLLMLTVPGLVMTLAMPRYIRRHSPWDMVERMRKSGELRVSLRDFFATTWNPGLPDTLENQIHGPGVATYWIGDAEQVHLRWAPGGGHPVHEWVGPVPEIPSKSKTTQRLGWVALLYPLSGVAGLALGWRHQGPDRVTAALWLALVAMFSVFLCLHVVMVVLGALGFGGRRSSPPV